MSETAPPPPKGKKMSYWQIAKSTLNEWLEDRASRLAASFSYYAIFAIGPLLIIAITLLGYLLGPKAASDQIRPQVAQFVGDKAADFIQEMIKAAHFSPHASLAGIISIGLILYAATNLFVSLQDSLNTIFDVEPKPGRGVMGIIKDRALSFLMVLIIGVFILASIFASAFLAAITKNLHVGNPTVTAFLIQLVNFIVSALIFTGVFSLLFKYLPDIKIDWNDTLIGAAATSIFFTLARIGLGYYLSRASVAGPFAAAGSLVIIMLFIYYSTQILFFGAEFTQVWARRHGQPIQPSENALSLDPDYTEPATEGTGSPTAASGATGSRRHFDSTQDAPRAPSASQRGREKPTEEMGKSLPHRSRIVPNRPESAPNQVLSPRGKTHFAPSSAASRKNPDELQIAQLHNCDPSPHYSAEKFHPPMPTRRGNYIELASAAALLAIPATWFAIRRK